MASITIAKADLAQLKLGDRITAIDGRPIDRTVTGPMADGRIPLAAPIADSLVDYALYPDTQVERDVTIEADDIEVGTTTRITLTDGRTGGVGCLNSNGTLWTLGGFGVASSGDLGWAMVTTTGAMPTEIEISAALEASPTYQAAMRRQSGEAIVQQPIQKASRKPRPAVSRRWGVTLIATTVPGVGEYKTEDGRYVVTKQWISTWCDDVPHPMRDGSYCTGGQEHVAWGWWAYGLDVHGNENECIADFLPTFGEAASALAQHIAKS